MGIWKPAESKSLMGGVIVPVCPIKSDAERVRSHALFASCIPGRNGVRGHHMSAGHAQSRS